MELKPNPIEQRVTEFIDSDKILGFSDQLGLMEDMWQRLGLVLPRLDEQTMERLKQRTEENPELRLVPAPILDLAGRTEVIEAAKQFGRNHFSDEEPGIWVPDSGVVYGELLRNPNDPMRTSQYSFPLAYKSPDGQRLIVGRDEWIGSMAADGRLKQGEDGTLWTFALIDTDPESDRSPQKSPGQLFADLDPSITAETALTVHVLHQVAGKPNDGLHVNFVNEAVAKVDNDGNVLDLVEIAGVRWYGEHGRVRLGHWVAGYYGHETFGFSRAVSAL